MFIQPVNSPKHIEQIPQSLVSSLLFLCLTYLCIFSLLSCPFCHDSYLCMLLKHTCYILVNIVFTKKTKLYNKLFDMSSQDKLLMLP